MLYEVITASLGGAEAGQRLAPGVVANAFEATCGERQRLVPTGFAKDGFRMCRIEAVQGLRDPLAANQRLCEPVGMADVVVAEAALHAQAAAVGWAVTPLDANDAGFLDVVWDRAASYNFV